MMMRRALLLFVLLSCALALPAPAGASALEEDLQAEIESFLAENPTAPGVAVYLVSPRLGLDWCGAAGTTAREGGEALTCAHTCRIASNTKTYVAAAVLRLVEQGRLSLDDPLGDIVAPDLAAALAGDGYDVPGHHPAPRAQPHRRAGRPHQRSPLRRDHHERAPAPLDQRRAAGLPGGVDGPHRGPGREVQVTRTVVTSSWAPSSSG